MFISASGLPPTHITVSSDSYGSLPRFDAKGNLIGYEYGKPSSLLALLRMYVLNKQKRAINKKRKKKKRKDKGEKKKKKKEEACPSKRNLMSYDYALLYEKKQW